MEHMSKEKVLKEKGNLCLKLLQYIMRKDGLKNLTLTRLLLNGGSGLSV